MHSVPSKDLLLNTRPHGSSFYGGSPSHRLKHLQKSDRRDISSSHESSTTNPHNLIQNKSKDLSMSDLKTCLIDLLNVEETGISTGSFNLAPEKNDNGNVVRESECIEADKSTSECKDVDKSTSGKSASEKCLSKCVTFTPSCGPKSSGDVFVGEKGKHEEDMTAEVFEGNGSAKPFNMCYSRSTSLPVPLKSAMKGSRQKQQQGTSSPKKLSVTWAPDVYDPIPTSVSHVPSDKNQRYRSKKSGKYKQKNGGKSSRGGSSKSKDKKQGRKSSGSSSNKLKRPFHMDSGVVLGKPWVGTLDYNVGRPDPFCGTSFLKESVTKLHFSVAEAT